MKAALKQIFTQELKHQANKAQKRHWWPPKTRSKLPQTLVQVEKQMKEIKQEKSNQLVFIVQEAEGQQGNPRNELQNHNKKAGRNGG